ncbi:MAG: hypothetical protein RH917_14535 [Lacipirellulaceae bacterium]
MRYQAPNDQKDLLDSNAKRERCQRLLARLGDKRITTADKANYFTPRAHAEAEQRAKGVGTTS